MKNDEGETVRPNQSEEPRLMVTAGAFSLFHVGEDLWSVVGPGTDRQFDDLVSAITMLSEMVDSSTRVEYHEALQEIQDEMSFADEPRLFPESPDGWWYVDDQLWVPAAAEDSWDDIFEYVDTYGSRGYFVYLYRWNNHYLFTYDEGYENRKVGWQVLGRIPHDEAITQAAEFAVSLDETTSMLIRLSDPEFIASLREAGGGKDIAALRAELEWILSEDEDDD